MNDPVADGRRRQASVENPGVPDKNDRASFGAPPGEALPAPPLDRRAFMAWLSALGLGSGLFPGVLWARAQEVPEITADVLEEAEKLAGLTFSADERELMLRGLRNNRDAYRALRARPIPNEVPPALAFDPLLPGREAPVGPDRMRPTRRADVPDPSSPAELAFWPITWQSELIRTRRVSSEELTRLYLDRLTRHGPTLEAVVTPLQDRALRQARRADAEIARGRWRGPLHGIPWGAKDLLATRDYPTTWGARPYQEQVVDADATVVRRLDDAGAVLVAKLTLGALAMGDYWFGGQTRNPWNLEQGSSGSSAGSAAATVAGLVTFGIGSETLGSIVSPATRTGATGLRPTFGRVSRHGAMALSWSMDKLGPLCRSVEDCALVFHAIHGADGLDPTARSTPFDWDPGQGLDGLRVGYLASAFDGDETRARYDRAALETVRGLGVEPVPVELPDAFPLGALRLILSAEAAAAFDHLTRTNEDDLLVRQTPGSWPNLFRTARFIPAVEYIQANRVRTMVMGALDAALDGLDVLMTPSYAEGILLMTNLTGHPAVVLPHGFDDDGAPLSFSFVGNLYRDAEALRLAKGFQDATDFHLRRPPGFDV
jgi:Asp-tRNA(Asn)/Glu-tRNA(Gln) amidotransferase A subunit family amidase